MQRKSRTYAASHDEPIDLLGNPSVSQPGMQVVHRGRCRPCGNRLEADDTRSIRSSLRDLVVGDLPAAALARKESIEVAMELEHQVRPRLHVGGVPMDRLEDVPVARDLLLGAIARRRFLGDQCRDALARCDDAFDPVRGLRALDHRCLAQRLEHLRSLPLEELLLASVLADRAHRGEHGVRDREPLQELAGEGLHAAVQSRRFIQYPKVIRTCSSR
jgi:hypothetical protein